MTYDFAGSWSNSGHHSPIYSDNNLSVDFSYKFVRKFFKEK